MLIEGIESLAAIRRDSLAGVTRAPTGMSTISGPCSPTHTAPPLARSVPEAKRGSAIWSKVLIGSKSGSDDDASMPPDQPPRVPANILPMVPNSPPIVGAALLPLIRFFSGLERIPFSPDHSRRS
ncbi:hypothetical protein IFT82_14220 [Sphingomonas sp. CFBP 8760]|nr:hypothetical protein [Sphingomonas sp. CFBP 8760]